MNKNTLLAFLGGVVAGGLVALLVAPKSGEETREMIADKVKEGIKAGLGDEKFNGLKEKIQSLEEKVASKFRKEVEEA